jgi:hypothetical protein
MFIPDSQRLAWFSCPPGSRLAGFIARAGNRPTFYPTQSPFYLRGVCIPISDSMQPSNPTASGTGDTSAQDGLPNNVSSSSGGSGSGPVSYPSMTLNLPRSFGIVTNTSTTLAVGVSGLLENAPQQGWVSGSSSNATLAHAVSCPAGEYVLSVTSVQDILPQTPWLVACSGGSRQLLGVPPASTAQDAASQAQEQAYLSSTPCPGSDIRKPRQILCRLGM